MRHPEPWMSLAVCVGFPELPWLADRDQASRVEVIGMRAACRSCGVFERCRAYVERAGISGGFWAGEFRDTPEDESSPGVEATGLGGAA